MPPIANGRRVAAMSPAVSRALKRAFDIVFTGASLVGIVPLVAVVGLFSLLVQGRPVFYISSRYVGRDRAVRIYKFRSMVLDARSPKYRLRERYMRDGYLDIPIDCEVYTRLGRFLERTQIVELPQVLNVIRDGMSWVGNRALPEENVRMLSPFPGWEQRFESPCGLTGISQVVGKLNLTPLERITVECLYSRVFLHGNVFRCDLLIILATVRLILFDRYMTYDEAIALLNSCL
jgi:lipopolysaccharide/colanic/teichoic acid biosynthesis glycosyltransferase